MRVPPLLLSFSLTLVPNAWAQAAPDVPVEVAIPTAQSRIDEAVRLYQTGRSQEAQAELAKIVNDSTPMSEDLRQKARLYLGEVLYLQGNKEEARRLFEAILERDSSFIIDPFQHPPDVCGFFETIRAYMRPSIEPKANQVPTGPIPRMPASAYYGFGIYQMQHGNRRLGTVMAIGQTAMAALSIATFGGLLEERTWASGSDLSGLRTKRTVQWTTTGAFYAFWFWGTINATQHWRANVYMQPSTGVGNNPNAQSPRIHIGFTIPTQ